MGVRSSHVALVHENCHAGNAERAQRSDQPPANMSLPNTRLFISNGPAKSMVKQEQSGAWTKAYEGGSFVRKSSEFRDVIEHGGTLSRRADATISTFPTLARGPTEPSWLEPFLV